MFKTILLLTKGIIRDQVLRRKLMFWIMLTALGMLFGGSVWLTDQWARQNPWLAIGFWAVCAWLTITAMLLALMDILLLRAMHRAARRAIEKELAENHAKREP